jgi:hypothetical protein
MASLHIHLQEGFCGEEVVVTVDGEERLRKGDVRTRRMLALASHDTFDVAEGPHAVDISIPARGIEKRIDVDAQGDVYVGLGLASDGLRVRVRDTRFGYG